MTDERTERLAAAIESITGPDSILWNAYDYTKMQDGHDGPRAASLTAYGFAARIIAADSALFAASDEALPSHPDDGHKHRYSCLRCGVDAPLPAASDEALREWDGLLAEPGSLPPARGYRARPPSPDRDRLAALPTTMLEAVNDEGVGHALFYPGDPDADLFAAWLGLTLREVTVGLPADHPARAAALGDPSGDRS